MQEASHHLDPEGVVPEEDVADPRDQDSGTGHLELVGEEEEVAALPGQHLGGGVVVDGHGHLLGAVDVVEDAGHRRRHAVEEQVVGIGATGGTQDDLRPLGHDGGAHPCAVRPRIDLGVHARVPPRSRVVGRGRGLGVGVGRRVGRDVGVDVAHGAVEALPGLGRHVVAAVDDGGRPHVGAPRLGLLALGQGEHPQGQDLVDLGRVVEIAGALGRHLRVVVEDDRRRQHHVGPTGRVGHQHGERAVVVALGGGEGPVRGRIQQGDERPVVDGQEGVDADERVGQRVVPPRPVTRPVRGVAHHDRHLQVALGSPSSRRHRRSPRRRRRPTDAPPGR